MNPTVDWLPICSVQLRFSFHIDPALSPCLFLTSRSLITLFTVASWLPENVKPLFQVFLQVSQCFYPLHFQLVLVVIVTATAVGFKTKGNDSVRSWKLRPSLFNVFTIPTMSWPHRNHGICLNQCVYNHINTVSVYYSSKHFTLKNITQTKAPISNMCPAVNPS